MPTGYDKGMVEAIDGLFSTDHAILRFVCRHDGIEPDGLRVNPKVIADNTDSKNDYVSKRMRRLESVGIFERHGRGDYSLTEFGRRVCSGELDNEERLDLESALSEYDSG